MNFLSLSVHILVISCPMLLCYKDKLCAPNHLIKMISSNLCIEVTSHSPRINEVFIHQSYLLLQLALPFIHQGRITLPSSFPKLQHTKKKLDVQSAVKRHSRNNPSRKTSLFVSSHSECLLLRAFKSATDGWMKCCSTETHAALVK